MENKNYFFLFPTIVSCLTLLSTSVFANWGTGNKQNNPFNQQRIEQPECSSMDLKVFEEDDEIQTYKDHGFSRGDMRNLYSYKYDPKTEQTFSGNIVKVMRVKFPDDNSYLLAVLKTDAGDYLVNFGPVWYADENNFEINEGDALSVRGSKIKTKGRYIIIASEAKKGGQNLVLRNRTGSPQWGNPKAQRGGEQFFRNENFNKSPNQLDMNNRNQFDNR